VSTKAHAQDRDPQHSLTMSAGDVSFCVVMVDDLPQRGVLILTSLADGPKHGYALIKDIEQFAGVTLGPGTLYGALARLEDAGLVRALPAQQRRHPTRSPLPGPQR
jgi:hypothetical protein